MWSICVFWSLLVDGPPIQRTRTHRNNWIGDCSDEQSTVWRFSNSSFCRFCFVWSVCNWRYVKIGCDSVYIAMASIGWWERKRHEHQFRSNAMKEIQFMAFWMMNDQKHQNSNLVHAIWEQQIVVICSTFVLCSVRWPNLTPSNSWQRNWIHHARNVCHLFPLISHFTSHNRRFAFAVRQFCS